VGDCWNLVLGHRPIANTNSGNSLWPIHVWQGSGTKFSPTLLVERELHQLIRRAVPPLLECVRREALHARSSSSAAAAVRPSRRAAGCGNEPSRAPIYAASFILPFGK
jgi:hypothetical protein